MIYVYGFCDGNSVHAVAEYRRRFLNRRIPTRRVFTWVYQSVRDTGTLRGVRIAAERDVNEGVDEEGIVQMVQSSPRASTRRIARRLHVPLTRVWRTLHAESMYPYHVQREKHLGPGDFAQRLEFCKWLSGSRQLHRYILFTDEAQFNRDGVNNTRNSHVRADENPHATVESNFQLRFNVNMWVQFWTISWLVFSSWKVILQERRTSDFCRRNCPDFWRTCFWINEVVCISNMTELLLILHVKLEISWTLFPWTMDRRGGPHNWPVRSPDLSQVDYCVWGWMKELVYSVKMGTPDALLGRILDAADRTRNSQRKLQWATRAVHNRAAACVAAGRGIFENQL